MIIVPKLPMGYTIFCDDVRHEVGGKTSYIGVYQDALYADHLPVKLARLYACVIVRDRILSDRSFNVKLMLQSLEDDSEEVLKESVAEFSPLGEEAVELETKFGQRFQEHHLYFELTPFTAVTRSLLKVRAYHGDDEYRMGALQIERWDADAKLDEDVVD